MWHAQWRCLLACFVAATISNHCNDVALAIVQTNNPVLVDNGDGTHNNDPDEQEYNPPLFIPFSSMAEFMEAFNLNPTTKQGAIPSDNHGTDGDAAKPALQSTEAVLRAVVEEIKTSEQLKETIVSLKCPIAHFVSIIDAKGTCGSVKVDLKVKVWELCANRDSCEFDSSIIGKCREDAVIDPITYTCSKVHAMECFLFHRVKDEKDGFCFHMCMHFLKDCQSRVMHVTREERLRCLNNLFTNHVLFHKCAYVMDNVEPDSVYFNTKEYLKPKYEMGMVTVSNKKWVSVEFKNRIENPVIITSISTLEDEMLVILIDNVTTAGFRISMTALSCIQTCKATDDPLETTIRWFAITVGDHSPDLNKAIRVGSLEGDADQPMALPLDPQKTWVVITQVQRVDVADETVKRNGAHVLAAPILFKSDHEYIVRYFIPNAEVKKKSRIVLGYLAFEDKEDINLYGVGLKPYMTSSDGLGRATITVKLPYTWPYPSHLYGSVLTLTEYTDPELVSYAYTLSKVEPSEKKQVIKLGQYNFSIDMRIESIDDADASLPSIHVNGVIIEDVTCALRRQICAFSRKKENIIINNACYDECVGINGIRSCVTSDNLINCYNDKSRSCSLEAKDLKDLPQQYIDYVRAHPEEDEVPKSASKGSTEVDGKSHMKDALSGKLTPSPNVAGGSTTAASNDVVNAGDSSDEEDIEIRRDCIEGPWGPWSECSNKCSSDKIKATQGRKRTIYAKNVGKGSKGCVILESRPCANIPPCSGYCYSREGSGNKSTFQQQYYYIWSDNCVNNDVRKLGFSYVSSSQHIGGGIYISGDTSGISGPKQLEVTKDKDASGQAAEIHPECNNQYYWTSCNAPCKLESGEMPLEYLKAPITCLDTKRSCTTKLEACPKKAREEESFTHGNCILKHAQYDLIEGTWSRDGSCICEGGVPCSAEELYLNADYSDIIRLETGSELEQSLRSTPYQILISLANGRNLQMPWGPVLDVTYGKFENNEVSNYCSSGSPELHTRPADLLWIDCSVAISRNHVQPSPSCKHRCIRIRKKCQTDIRNQSFDELAICVKNRLENDILNIYTIGFNMHKCRTPNFGPGLMDADAICNSDKSTENYNRTCSSLCERVLNFCKMKESHNREAVIRRCMLDHMDLNDVTLSDNSPVDFKQLCTFKKTKIYGAGLVYCKTKEIICDLEEWSEWDECSGTCITVTPEKNIIPTRTRTRKVKNNDAVIGARCLAKGIHFEERAECLWLPQCQEDKIIIDEIMKVKQHVSWEVVLPTSWDLQSWVLEESLDAGNDSSRNCSIFSGQRDVSNNKIIYERSRCSCPPSMKPCSVRDSVNSYRWFDMLELLCKQNEMRSVLFNQSSGFFRYSCSTKTFIREDFDSHKELCNELDGTTFVSCSGESIYTHLYIFCIMGLVMGALTASLFFVYTYNRSSFVYRRMKECNAHRINDPHGRNRMARIGAETA